jgi:hypothetical protein
MHRYAVNGRAMHAKRTATVSERWARAMLGGK